MPFLKNLYLIISVVTSVSYTTASQHYLPSETRDLHCYGLQAKCVRQYCKYTRSLIYQGQEKYYSGQQRLHTCGPVEMQVFYPKEKNKSFTYESQVMCYTYKSIMGDSFHVLEVLIFKPQNCDSSSIFCHKNCIKTHENTTSVRYLAGIPKVCTPFKTFTPYVPSRIPELLCLTDNMCEDSTKPCKYKGNLTRTESSAIYSQSLQVKVSCDSLYAYLTCPDGAEDQFCSHDLKCYLYKLIESKRNKTLNGMVAVLTKTEDLDFDSDPYSCINQNKECSVFSRTASTSGFAWGIPKYCIPWTEFDPKSDVFLPSKAQQLVCRGTPCYDFCRLESKLLHQKSGSFGGGMTPESYCGSLEITTACPLNMHPSQLCSQTNKCYEYKDMDAYTHLKFYVLEVTVQHPVGINDGTNEVDCQFNSKSCPIYEKTSSSVTFVVSSHKHNCYPWTMTDSDLEN